MSYLIVVAHPDDEVLGAGGSIYNLSRNGEEVNVCIMSSNAEARTMRPGDADFEQDIKASLDVLGVHNVIKGNFPNIMLNTIPHLELVRFIEKSIIETQADVIITHHPSDVNNDHLHTSLACQAAVRLFQRKSGIKALRQFLYMEVLSSTEWCTNTSFNAFMPNTFMKIGQDGVSKKLNALAQYRNVMRPYPHPRSREAIEGLAAFRGAQSGLAYAEAFESVYKNSL